jgi:nucleoside-diphosphate-sugar epimerase
MVTINGLAQLAMKISGKQLKIRNVPGPIGVRGRNSDNRLIREKLGWEPDAPLEDGLRKTYAWIEEQVQAASLGFDAKP